MVSPLSPRTFACSLRFYFDTETTTGWVPDFAGVLHSYALVANEARWSGLPSRLFFGYPLLEIRLGYAVHVYLDFGKL